MSEHIDTEYTGLRPGTEAQLIDILPHGKANVTSLFSFSTQAATMMTHLKYLMP